MENPKKSWKIRKSHGKSEKVMENPKKSWKSEKVIENLKNYRF